MTQGGGTLARRPAPLWLVVLATVTVALPVLVAVAALRRPTWYPVLDLAMTELRVRDVGTADTPLVGLPGRIGPLDRQGSHPGPLSFYLLAPAYRLLGSTSWALQAATAVLNALAMAVALLVARRRGGVRVVLAVAAVLAVLTVAHGTAASTEPWNPYLPLLWWVVFLLAAWSMTCGDLAMAPVAAFAASICAQTHLPYLGLTGVLGVGALVVGVAGVAVDRQARRHAARWVLATGALIVLLWSPVVVDQLTGDPGNVTLLREHMFDPPEAPVGLRAGLRLMVEHLDPLALLRAGEGDVGSLVDSSHRPERSVGAGSVVLALWLASALTAWRRRAGRVLRLHAVLGAAFALGVASSARIFGRLWFYLTLWGWALAVLVGVAVAWTVADALADRRQVRSRSAYAATTGALAAIVIAFAAVGAFRSSSVGPPAPALSRSLGLVLDGTEAALRSGVGAADGERGRYVVHWSDALYIGSQGYGLVNELERRGLDVGGMPWTAVPLTAHRAFDPTSATAAVHLANGPFIEQWRARPGAVEVAAVDPRTPAERAEYQRLRNRVVDDLIGAGLPDVVPLVDRNLFGASLDPRLEQTTVDRMARMLELGTGLAVFIAPPDTQP